MRAANTIALGKARRERLTADAEAEGDGDGAAASAAAAAAAGGPGEVEDDGASDLAQAEAEAVELLQGLAAGAPELDGELLPVDDAAPEEEQAAAAAAADTVGQQGLDLLAALEDDDMLFQGEDWGGEGDDWEGRQPDDRRRSFSEPPPGLAPRQRGKRRAPEFTYDVDSVEELLGFPPDKEGAEEESPYKPSTAEKAAAAAESEEPSSGGYAAHMHVWHWAAQGPWLTAILPSGCSWSLAVVAAVFGNIYSCSILS